MQTIRLALKQARERNGLTALQLAAKAETSEARLYSYERGRCTPKPDEAARIAAVLGVTLESIFPEVQP